MFEAEGRVIHKVGGVTALLSVAVVLAEILINFLPGLPPVPPAKLTVIDWFTLFQHHWFFGLRNLGLMNLAGAVLLAPTFLSLYLAQRRVARNYAAAGAVLFFLGLAVYVAGNRAFPMLALSKHYAAAVTEAQRASLIGVGQAMLAQADNRIGIFLMELAGLILSAVMRRGTVFSPATAVAGVLGNVLLLLVECILAIERQLSGAALGVAAAGGLAMMIWYLLVGLRLLRRGSLPSG